MCTCVCSHTCDLSAEVVEGGDQQLTMVMQYAGGQHGLRDSVLTRIKQMSVKLSLLGTTDVVQW